MKRILARLCAITYLLFMALPVVIPLAACDGALTFLAGESHGGGLAASNWSGTGASVSSASFVTARTQAEWAALWQLTGQPAPGALPDGKMAVAVFLGQRFDPATRVEIHSAEVLRRIGEPEHAVVSYRELTLPGPAKAANNAANAATVVSPWAVRLMDRTVLEPDYQHEGG